MTEAEKEKLADEIETGTSNFAGWSPRDIFIAGLEARPKLTESVINAVGILCQHGDATSPGFYDAWNNLQKQYDRLTSTENGGT